MKKVLVLSCHGGGGHIAAAQAVSSMLQNYEVKTVDIIGKEQAHIDPLYWLTGKRYLAHDFYNFLLRTNKKTLINILFYVGLFLIKIRTKGIINSIKRVFQREKPDLIISVVPLINDHIINVADSMGIPVIIIPTDLDIRTFINKLPTVHQHKTTIALSYDYPEIVQNMESNTQKNYTITTTGFPIRPCFFSPKDKDSIKKSLHIPGNAAVVLLVMGAAGSISLINYVKCLFKAQQSFHLIICVGRAHHLKPILQKLIPPAHITLSIVDEHSNMSDLMGIADICITKPGSVTFNENIYSHVPMLLDATSPVLLWEKFNITFLEKHQLGFVIKNFKDIYQKIDLLLSNRNLLETIKNNFSKLSKKNLCNELPKIVSNMLG